MTIQETTFEMVEYRLVLVEPDSRKILALDILGAWRLPTVHIQPWARVAKQLCQAARTVWGLRIILLDVIPDVDLTQCAIAELILPNSHAELKAIPLRLIDDADLTEEQRVHIASLLSDNIENFFSQIGWLDRASLWLETENGRKLKSKTHIDQYDAGDGFSLVCFHMQDGRSCWLKATGEPNTHEFAVTRLLSELGGNYLPSMISFHSAWNAWLMSGDAKPIVTLPSDPLRLFLLLEDAVSSMAELQIGTVGRTSELLKAGAFDQSTESFQRHSAELFDFLDEAMALQTSKKIAPINKNRLREIRTVLEAVCHRVDDLDLPQTILHGDLNRGNILTGCGHSQFIDWSEAYVGNPLISLQHLLLLNTVENTGLRAVINAALKDRYRTRWVTGWDAEAIDGAFVYMPLLAIASTLFGRGNWLHTAERDDVRRQSYARSLTRHLDRAVRDPKLLEALCL